MAWSFGNNSSFIDAGAYTMRGFDSDNSGNAETAIQNFIDAIKTEITKMQSTTESPDVLSVEDTTTSPIAVYRISIQIDYIDNTQKLWK